MSATSDESVQKNANLENKRIVPAFTTQALQRNTQVTPPPNCGVYKVKRSSHTKFKTMYERGDFPIGLKHDTKGNVIAWRAVIETLDFNHYLPLFMDGLRELTHPYEFFARQGTHDMLDHGRGKVMQTLPRLIQPLKQALNTRNHQVICTTLKVLVHLVESDEHVGEALVPYYRQLLPVLSLFKNKNCNTGDGIDYSQRKQENLGDLIEDTLNALERTGGSHAYINIKYMIPTYESCLLNLSK